MGRINDVPLRLILVVLTLISRKKLSLRFLLDSGSLIRVGNDLLLHEEQLELLYFSLSQVNSVSILLISVGILLVFLVLMSCGGCG
jgi:hypothetical protein